MNLSPDLLALGLSGTYEGDRSNALQLGPQAFAAFIAFIGILIFVHELGHFLAAKLFDIKVVKFSLGFGPPLLSFRWGETTYQIAAVPLGGFVKMVGDNPHEDVAPQDEARAFTRAPIYQRALVALAGPLFNFLFPIVCFFAYNVVGPEVLAPEVGSVEPGQPAARAGLKAGDRIVSVDGHRTWSFQRLVELIQARPKQASQLIVERDGTLVDLEIVPDAREDRDAFGQMREIGIIGVASRRVGTRVGVVDRARAPPSVRTGDEILSVGDRPVTDLVELESALMARAGEMIEIHLARTVELGAGGLLTGQRQSPLSMTFDVPADFDGLASLGLAASDAFVRTIVPGSAADRAGIRAGDQVVSVGGQPVHHFWAFQLALAKAEAEPVDVTFRRENRLERVTMKNDAVACFNEMTGEDEVRYLPGFGVRPSGDKPDCRRVQYGEVTHANWDSSAPPRLETPRLTLAESAVEAVRQTVAVIGLVAKGLFMLLSGQISTSNVGGPLSMFGVAAAAAEQGLLQYLKMLALISVNLGLVNLLPIPILDGGHLMFCAVEAIRREPVSMRTRELASMVGLVLLFAVLVLALHNDLLRLDKLF